MQGMDSAARAKVGSRGCTSVTPSVRDLRAKEESENIRHRLTGRRNSHLVCAVDQMLVLGMLSSEIDGQGEGQVVSIC